MARHCDGELLDYSTVEGAVDPNNPENKDYTLEIRKAIRPWRVAVLTLRNDTVGGGTRVHNKATEESQVFAAQAGDLLVFNNLTNDHSVDSMMPKAGIAEDHMVRSTIGWRSLEENTVLYQKGADAELTPISFDDAVALHRDYMKDAWPAKAEAMKANELKAAF